jgi:DNA-binding NarL/FixJ family response regulator
MSLESAATEEKASVAIRILLVDDHGVVRAGLRGLLEAEPDFEVVGEADNGMRAVQLAHRLRPDVVVTDLLLPDIDGVAVTQQIRSELPETQVIILTGVNEQDPWLVRAIRAGAISYIAKTADVHEVLRAIRQAATGEVYVSSRVAARLMQEVRSPHQVCLTDRERDVLREIIVGRADKEIAQSLAIALSTVKTHVRSILEKLGVDSRTQAVVHVLRNKMLSLDELGGT